MKRTLSIPTVLLLSCAAFACTRKNPEKENPDTVPPITDTTTPSTDSGIQEGTIPPPESVRDIPLNEAAPPRHSEVNCDDPNVPDEDKISAKCPETGVGRTNPIPTTPPATATPTP